MSQHDGISLRRFAEQVGVSQRCLLRWCRAGKVIGARKHPLTKKWMIYPPAKLVLDGLHELSRRQLPGYVPPPAPAPKTDKPVRWMSGFVIDTKGGAA